MSIRRKGLTVALGVGALALIAGASALNLPGSKIAARFQQDTSMSRDATPDFRSGGAAARAAVLRTPVVASQGSGGSDKAVISVPQPAGLRGVAADNGPGSIRPGSNKAAGRVSHGPQMHIVMFREAPLATYRGGTASLDQAQSRANSTNTGRIDPKSRAARTYVNGLEIQQRRHESAISAEIGRSLKVQMRMQHAVNAVIAELTPGEADLVKRNPAVLLVEPYREYVLDTDAGPQLIGAPAIWSSGSGLPGVLGASGPAKGEGVVFAILDSGINAASPSFAATDSQGYSHVNPLGAGTFLGTCASGEIDEGLCNDKLIGGYDFVCGAPANTCGATDITEEPGFLDNNGHGSHTASTAAGSHRDAIFSGAALHLSGVAPRGTIIAHDICYTRTSTGQGLCPNVSAVAAVNQALADGIVDVINYSIGGGAAPWSESVSLAFLNAADAGIYIATSAGNSGPGAGTLGHNEPWTASTAAATHNRDGFGFVFSVTAPTPVPAALTSILARPGVNGVAHTSAIPGTTPLVVSPNIDAGNDGCNAGAAYPANTFQNAIAVIRRGTCAFAEKTNNATAAGAIAVVIANNQPGVIPPSVPGTTIPAFMISQVEANAVRDFHAASPAGSARAGIGYPGVSIPGLADVLGSFSSRGPAAFDVLKPDITAPGVQILAAVAGAPEALALYNGTSMSSPHNAGAAGLLRQLNPSWSVPEIKSALVMTAAQTVLLENGTTPAGPFAAGGGRISVNLAARSGLVMNETRARYLAADPNNGGDPATLNQPSMARKDCVASCTFTRTFRSTRPHFQLWDLSLDGSLVGTVWPSKMFVWGMGQHSVTVTINSSGIPANGTWQFGKLVMQPIFAVGSTASPTLRLPIAVAVQPPPVPPTALVNGVPVNVAGAAGSNQFYTLEVPAGATNLVIATSGGTGDLDLYVRLGSAPTDAVFDCRPFLNGNDESCEVAAPAAGTYWVRLNGFTAYSGATLTGSFTP